MFPYVCINMNIRTSRGELSVKRYDSRRFSMHFLQVLFMPEWSKCLHDLEAFSSRSKTFASAQLDFGFQGQTPDEICDSEDTMVVNSKRQAKYLCFLTDCKQIHIGFPPVSFERNVRSLGRIRSPRVPLFKDQSWSTANIGERSFLMVQHYFHERPKCDWLWRMYLFQKQTVWIKTFFFHFLFCYFMNLRHVVLRMEVGMKSK